MSNEKNLKKELLQNQVYGIHAVSALLASSPEKIALLYLNQDRHDQKFKLILDLAQKNNIIIKNIKNIKDIKNIHQITQGVVALIKPAINSNYLITNIEELFQDSNFSASASARLLLILDGVQDPHNLGACLRTANGAGADAVIIPKNNAAVLNATVRKVASGAAEFTPVITVTNLSRTLEYLKKQGVWLYGMSGSASVSGSKKSLYEENFKLPTAFVLGSEAEGLRWLTEEYCDSILSIPMQGEIDSLNVSVAAGICLFEAVRQRQK